MAKRVISLIASGTEIVCALDRGDWLVGRSHECDFPATVRALPHLTEPKFAVDGSSRVIDDNVKAVLESGLSVYRVDAERLRALRPNVVVTQDQCEVCAVSLRDVEAAVCDWTGDSVEIVSLRPDGLDDVWEDIRRVAEALDRGNEGRRLIAGMSARMEKISAQAKTLTTRPTVACIEWIDPLMAAGNWMPTLVEMAGGKNLFGSAGIHAPWLEWKDLAAADPDLIVILPCGFGIPRILEETHVLEALPGWPDLTAARTGRVFVTDGNQYFNRPGPRLVESLEILAEILHPETFTFGHQGTGWIPLDRTETQSGKT